MKNVLLYCAAAALLLSSCATQHAVQTSTLKPSAEGIHPSVSSNGLALQAGQSRSGLPSDMAAEAPPAVAQGVAPSEPVPIFWADTRHADQSEAKQALMAQKISKLQSKMQNYQAKHQSTTTAKRLNVVQKVVLNKALRTMQKAKSQDDIKDFHDLDGRLKIGVLLLGVALILALFGLGLIAGIAGLVALCFIVLGLMGMYY